MNNCKLCQKYDDTTFSEQFSICWHCFITHPQSTNYMNKSIEDYQKEIIDTEDTVKYYKNDIKFLESSLKVSEAREADLYEEVKHLQNELECWKKNGEVKTDVVKRQKEILDKTLWQLPVGYVPAHTYENIPDVVAHLVKEHAANEVDFENATDYIATVMPNFYKEYEGTTMLDTVKRLVKMGNDAILSDWSQGESLEALEHGIKDLYECNKRPNAPADLSASDMLNLMLHNGVSNGKDQSAVELLKENAVLSEHNILLGKELGDITDEFDELNNLVDTINEFYDKYNPLSSGKEDTPIKKLIYILKDVPNYKPTKEEHDLEDMKRHCDHYIKALEEITKKNRKAETCRMIALKALGEFDDEDYQAPELLREENLKLRMQVEDLESKLIDTTLEKVFPKEEDLEPRYRGAVYEDYSGATLCKHCNKVHWMYAICDQNPIPYNTVTCEKPKPTLANVRPPRPTFH